MYRVDTAYQERHRVPVRVPRFQIHMNELAHRIILDLVLARMAMKRKRTEHPTILNPGIHSSNSYATYHSSSLAVSCNTFVQS